MADRVGGSINYTSYLGGKSPSRVATSLPQVYVTSLWFKGRPTLNASSTGTPIIEYKKRARDLGSPTTVYTEWVTLDPDATPPITPPVGPWGEIRIVGVWYPPVGGRET